MTKWKYGNAWERFPIEAGEIWGIAENESKVSVHDIFNPLPEFMKEADMIFVDPPWNRGNVNTFYTKAEKQDEHITDFKDFENAVFAALESIAPKILYIEMGKQNVDIWEERLKKLYPHVQRWASTYYKKHLTYILRGGYSPTEHDYTGIDEEKVISLVAEHEDYECLGDICMGLGLVGIAAYKNSKPFVGTELNKRRLANLLQKVDKLGGKITKLK